jgi:hypothetical protein
MMNRPRSSSTPKRPVTNQHQTARNLEDAVIAVSRGANYAFDMADDIALI